MYQAGELDQIINISRWLYTDDGQGGQEKQLSVICYDLYAKQRPMTGNESDRYDKLNAVGMSVFVIRYDDDIKENDLIEWNGKKFNIRYLKDYGSRSLYLEIFAEFGWPN